MPEVRPFRAIRYGDAATDPLEQVLAPPYDIISPSQHRELLGSHPHNIVRLTLGDDGDPSEWHGAAARRMGDWLARGILVRDEAPGFYAYSQTFSHGDTSVTRMAIMAMVRLSEFGKGDVRPHERTLSGPKQDRLKLMHATWANTSPIFALGPTSPSLRALRESFQSKPPLARATDDAGVVHELRVTTDPQDHDLVQRELADQPIYIADGHHRYETALTFRYEVASSTEYQGKGSPPDYVLMAIVAMDDPGLIILPAHRLVRYPEGTDGATLHERLQHELDVEPAPPPEGDLVSAVTAMTLRPPEMHRFGVYTAGGRWSSVQTPRASASASPLNRLDVIALQRAILKPHLQIDAAEIDRAERIAYTHDPVEAVARVDAGDFDSVFFIRPPDVSEVQAVADAGEYMPQKGTYFYPKLITGMVLADLRSW